MNQDTWNVEQYELFKSQRERPFKDLLQLIQKKGPNRAIDLGCGTGELTQKLHTTLQLTSTLGIDSSAKMLDKAQSYKVPGLSFALKDISELEGTYDLIFSHAALHWVDNHPQLLKNLVGHLTGHGQLAFQIPMNHDHLSHTLARSLAQTQFKSELQGPLKETSVLSLEKYAELMYKLGFKDQVCRVEVYGHPMSSGKEVVEWVKGSLLTEYQQKMNPQSYSRFVEEYENHLLEQIGTGPYFYAFKRGLFWGQLA